MPCIGWHGALVCWMKAKSWKQQHAALKSPSPHTSPSSIPSRNVSKCKSSELNLKFLCQDQINFLIGVKACCQSTQERCLVLYRLSVAVGLPPQPPKHIRHAPTMKHQSESSCLPPTICLGKGNRISHRQEKRALEAVCTQTISQK